MADPVRPAISRHVMKAAARGILMFLGVVCLGQVSATAQDSSNAQDSDSEFLEFDNAFVPSPQQLIDHLNQLRGVQLQLGGEGRNGLPGDREFQEWVTKELLPSLGEEQQQELKAIAERMMERRLGGSPLGAGSGQEGTGSDSQESPLSALREELRQNPELESSLREQLQRRPGNQPLSNLLQSPASEFEPGRVRSSDTQRQNRDGRSSPPGRNDGETINNGTAGDAGVQQNGSAGAGDANRGGELPARGGAPGSEDVRQGTGSGGSQPSRSGEPSQAGTPGAEGATDPQDNARSRSGTDGSQSDATQPNRFPDRIGQDADDEQGGRDVSQGSAENNPSMRGSQDGDRLPSPIRSEPSERAPNRPSRPGRGTPGRGTPGRGTAGQTPSSLGNDGDDGRLNRTSPPAREDKNESNRSSDSRPNESFRDRMNRILLDAAKDSTSGDGGEGEPKEGMLDGLLNQVAARFQESMRDPKRQRHFRDRFEQQRRSVSNSSLPSTNVLSRSSDLLSDASGPGLLVTVLLIGAFTFVLVMFFSTPLRDRVFGAMTQYASNLNKTRRYHVPEIASADDLVVAVDQFVFWRFGLGAHWWHGGYVHQQLVEAHPHRMIEIDQLLDAYETARYSPTSDILDEQRFAATARCLQQLKDEALAQAADGPPTDETWIASREVTSMIGGSPGPTR